MYSELTYELSLCQVPYIGPVHAKKLCDIFGSASAIFKANVQDLEKVENIGDIKARSIKSFKDFSKAEKEINFIAKYGIKPLFLTSKEYPQRLLNCFDPPTILFYKGNADLNASRIIAIVGTRNNTVYGKTFTEKLVKALERFNVIIVSGLAFGIDSIAHKCSLKYGIRTIGVMGHGLDIIYPPDNINLAKQMIREGGLLTEFRSNTKPDKHNFPSRNRVVAGISDATVVVESGQKGGSNITANLAWGYNRDVFAVPGRSTDIKSEGCNRLIRENKAMLLDDPEQLFEVMGWNDQKAKKTTLQREMFPHFTEEEKKIIELLRKNEFATIDDINFNSGLSSSSVASATLHLEMQGVLKVLPGKRYVLNDTV
ncbi:MAG TPA: DNA-processing protein DprA [Flavitalea sp.]|nr:DNA-processing protein DprA [Flavitalea sp.]